MAGKQAACSQRDFHHGLHAPTAWQAGQDLSALSQTALQQIGTSQAPQSRTWHARQAQFDLELIKPCHQPLQSRSERLPARPATASASRAIKQSAGSPSSSSAFAELGTKSESQPECYACQHQSCSAHAVTAVDSAKLFQQDCCCDCGYVTKQPGNSSLKLGFSRPASACGFRAVTPAAVRPLSADMTKGGKPAVPKAFAASPTGAFGSLPSPDLCSCDILAVGAAKGQGVPSPLSQLQQSFRAQMQSESSLAAHAKDIPIEPDQAPPITDMSAGCQQACCGQDGAALLPAALPSSAAAALDMQQVASSEEGTQQTELSPETSFLQMLDQCQQHGSVLPAPTSTQPNVQQQPEPLSFISEDATAMNGSTGCQSLYPVSTQLQQQGAGARALGRPSYQSPGGLEPVAAYSAVFPASTCATGGSVAMVGTEDSSPVKAADEPMQRDKLHQPGACIADNKHCTQDGLSKAKSQLCGDAMPQQLCPSPLPVVLGVPVKPQPLKHRILPAVATADTPATPRKATPDDAVSDEVVHGHHRQQAEAQPGSLIEFPLQAVPAQAVRNSDQGSQWPVSAEEAKAKQQRQSPHVYAERRDASTEAMCTCPEEDQTQLFSKSRTAQQQWFAVRRRSDRAEAKWELYESDGSDSEGSVSTESTLRPSSVGRCRVNSGRHAKVCSSISLYGIPLRHFCCFMLILCRSSEVMSNT